MKPNPEESNPQEELLSSLKSEVRAELSAVQQRIEKRLKEIVLELNTATAVQNANPKNAMVSARRAGEAICRLIYFQENGAEFKGRLTLDDMVPELQKANLINPVTATYLRTIQAYGSLGAHNHAEGEEDISPKTVAPTLEALANLIQSVAEKYQYKLPTSHSSPCPEPSVRTARASRRLGTGIIVGGSIALIGALVAGAYLMLSDKKPHPVVAIPTPTSQAPVSSKSLSTASPAVTLTEPSATPPPIETLPEKPAVPATDVLQAPPPAISVALSPQRQQTSVPLRQPSTTTVTTSGFSPAREIDGPIPLDVVQEAPASTTNPAKNPYKKKPIAPSLPTPSEKKEIPITPSP